MISNSMVAGFRAAKELVNKIDIITHKVNKKLNKIVYLAGNNIVFMDAISKEQIILSGTEDTDCILTYDISSCKSFLVVSEQCQLAGIITIFDISDLFDGQIRKKKVMTSSQCQTKSYSDALFLP